GVEAFSERLRQRQRRARLQHHGSPSRRRRGRAGRGLHRSVLHRPPAQRLLHPALSQPRRREARLHPRLRLPGRRGAGRPGGAGRLGWTRLMLDQSLGADLKDKATAPGPWYIRMGGFGEILPNHANRVTLDKTRKDKWGLPLLAFDAQLRDNEMKMRKDMAN